MKHRRPLPAALAAALLLTLAAQAQTTPPTSKPVASANKAPARKAAPAEIPLAQAEGEQLAAAAMTHIGDYACEFDQAVNIAVTPNHEGYVNLRFKSQTWTMKPVLSSTGALRLEDVKGRMLMLQIANKSMLMDTQLGQRVVDACIHDKQRAANAAAQPGSNTLLQGAASAAPSAR